MSENRNTEFLLETMKARDHVEDLGIHGRIIVKWILKRQNRRAWTIHLAEDWGKCQTLLGIVINLLGLYSVGSFLTRWRHIRFLRRIGLVSLLVSRSVGWVYLLTHWRTQPPVRRLGSLGPLIHSRLWDGIQRPTQHHITTGVCIEVNKN